MIAIQKFDMYLDRPEKILRVCGVQGDALSRGVCFLMHQNGRDWMIPEDIRVTVWYVKPDRTGGMYDALPDRTPAWKAAGSALTVYLAPQMFTAAGDVQVQLELKCGEAVLHSFAFTLEVSRSLTLTEGSRDYFRRQYDYLPQTSGAEAGQLLRIDAVDDQGRVTRISGTEMTGLGEKGDPGVNVLMNFIPAKTRIAAHRGDMEAYPENTIPAFRSAGEKGAWGIETDVRLTSDGYLVCIHNSTVDACTNGTGSVSTYTLAQLQALHIDYGEAYGSYSDDKLEVPLFSDYLAICREFGCVALVHLQELGDAYVRAVYDAVKDAGLLNSAVFQSGSVAEMQTVRAIDPNTMVCTAHNSVTRTEVDAALAMGGPVAVHCNSQGGITAEVMNYAHESGVFVFSGVGVTNAPVDALEYWTNLGVDVIASTYLSSSQLTDLPKYSQADAGKALIVGPDGKPAWETVQTESSGSTYVLPVATAGTLGGIKADPVTSEDTQPVRIGEDGKLYTVPGAGSGSVTPLPSSDEWDVHYKANIAEALENGFEITEVDGKPLQLKELWALVKLQSAVDSAWLGCEITTDNPSVVTCSAAAEVGGVNANTNDYAYFTYHAIILPESNRFIVDVSCARGRNEKLIRITNDNWLHNWLEYNPVNYFTGIKCNNNLGAGTSHGYGTEIELWGKTK